MSRPPAQKMRPNTVCSVILNNSLLLVLCTSPNKFTVIDPEGVIAAQSCIDIVVRYSQPSTTHCNTTEKFRITMYDRNTQQVSICLFPFHQTWLKF